MRQAESKGHDKKRRKEEEKGRREKGDEVSFALK